MTVDRVDVIICTNSDGAYLGAALDSVAQQTWRGWSVTIVDDGSPHPDALARVVEGRERVRMIRQENRGLPAARNAGLSATDAEWITFLDDDDIWDARRLELLVAAIESGGDVIAAYSGGWNIDPHGRSIGHEWDAVPTTSRDMIRGAAPFPRLFTLLAARCALELAGPFDESYSLAEDNEFLLRFLTVGELAAVPERLVGYRRHGRNMSADRRTGEDPSRRIFREAIARARARQDDDLVGLIRENERRYRRATSRLRADDALQHARRGRLGAAIVGGWDALRTSPLGVADSLADKARRSARRVMRHGGG